MAGKISAIQQATMASFRGNFPVLQKTMNGQPVAFLDTGASAQKPQAVIDAMKAAMDTEYANIHRGLYQFSQVTTAKFEAVRAKVADFIGARSEKEIVFTRNATEGINLVAQSWGRTFLKAGDEVIITGMEHHANIVPWQLLRDQAGIIIRVIPVLQNGTLDLESLEKLLSPKTKFVSFVHVSNALGTINPVETIIQRIRNYNKDIRILVDGSQAVVHGAVNMSEMDPDFYVFTGHKLYGPTGIGVLYGRYDVLQSMPPYQGGGDMIERVTFEKTTYKDAPARFEAGTPAIVEVMGLGAAIDYVANIGMDVIAAQEQDLLAYGLETIGAVEGLTLYGPTENRAGIISFTADWGHASDIAMVLDQCGVAVRSGHHCCQPLMEGFGIDATVRASLGLYSNKGDIDQLVAGLEKARKLLSE
jgi:cysteine desulfurase/selenocysteine lyase